MVAKRVAEELERRKEEIEAEVMRRVEEAKKVMEAEMLQEMERRKQQQLEEARMREVRSLFFWPSGIFSMRRVSNSENYDVAIDTPTGSLCEFLTPSSFPPRELIYIYQFWRLLGNFLNLTF